MLSRILFRSLLLALASVIAPWEAVAGPQGGASSARTVGRSDALLVRLLPAKKPTASTQPTLLVFEAGSPQDRWFSKHLKAGSPLARQTRIVRVGKGSDLRRRHGVKNGESRMVLLSRRGTVQGHYSGPLAARLVLEDVRRGY